MSNNEHNVETPQPARVAMQQDTPHCPRCRYDLAGEVARWNGAREEGAACPLTGTCSECGLDFHWRFVMRPSLSALRWFVEYVPVAGQLPPRRFRVLRTCFAACVPWWFWQRVRLETPMRPRSQAWWGVWMVVMAFTVLLASFSIPLFYEWTLVQLGLGGGRWWRRGSLLRALSLGNLNGLQHFAEMFFRASSSPWTATWVGGLIAYPAMMLVLTDTRRMAKVHRSHILRASVYAASPLLLILLVKPLGMLGNWLLEIVSPPIHPVIGPLIENMTDTFSHDSWWRSARYSSAHLLAGLLLLVWFPLYWCCALKFGYRMREWKPALISAMIPALIIQAFLALTNIEQFDSF